MCTSNRSTIPSALAIYAQLSAALKVAAMIWVEAINGRLPLHKPAANGYTNPSNSTELRSFYSVNSHLLCCLFFKIDRLEIELYGKFNYLSFGNPYTISYIQRRTHGDVWMTLQHSPSTPQWLYIEPKACSCSVEVVKSFNTISYQQTTTCNATYQPCLGSRRQLLFV